MDCYSPHLSELTCVGQWPSWGEVHACPRAAAGRPPLPLLFVIAMDILTEVMIKAHDDNILGQMTGCNPMQRLSLYDNDVVLFVKPTLQDCEFVKESMDIFGRASGLKVNFTKSAAILIREEEGDEALVQAALPWKIDHFPVRYLGLQLSISRLTRSDWQLVVDAALKLLPGWKRGLVGRPGRLILVN